MQPKGLQLCPPEPLFADPAISFLYHHYNNLSTNQTSLLSIITTLPSLSLFVASFCIVVALPDLPSLHSQQREGGLLRAPTATRWVYREFALSNFAPHPFRSRAVPAQTRCQHHCFSIAIRHGLDSFANPTCGIDSMFREPEEITAEQAAAKLDAIAATRRSTIRRESTVRPGRSPPSRSTIDRVREVRRDPPTTSTSSSLRPIRSYRDIDPELERRSIQRYRDRVSRLDREAVRRANNDYIRPEPEPRVDSDVEPWNRLPVDPATPPDGLTTEAILDSLLPSTTELIPQHLPRPSRESGLRFEVGVTSRSESASRQRRAATTRNQPPSPSGARRPRWFYGSGNPDVEDGENEESSRSATEVRRPDRAPMVDGPISTPPPESLEVPYPPLRRVNHLSPHPLGDVGSRVDGLGDRMRSLSPAPLELVEENWENLLHTMEPARSSAATSFLSSRSDSGNGSNRSSQATTVATSFGEIGADDSCDLDLPSGITEEDVREIRARHGRLRRGPLLRLSGSQDPNQLILGGDRDHDRTHELELFAEILDRMQRREEVPEEYWQAVGLSPDVLRGNA